MAGATSAAAALSLIASLVIGGRPEWLILLEGAAMIALIFGLGFPFSSPGEILGLDGFFVALFVGSALLFRKAARGESAPGAV